MGERDTEVRRGARQVRRAEGVAAILAVRARQGTGRQKEGLSQLGALVPGSVIM